MSREFSPFEAAVTLVGLALLVLGVLLWAAWTSTLDPEPHCHPQADETTTNVEMCQL